MCFLSRHPIRGYVLHSDRSKDLTTYICMVIFMNSMITNLVPKNKIWVHGTFFFLTIYMLIYLIGLDICICIEQCVSHLKLEVAWEMQWEGVLRGKGISIIQNMYYFHCLKHWSNILV